MGAVFQSDIVHPEGPCAAKKAHRLEEIKKWFGFFAQHFRDDLEIDLNFIDQAAEVVNSSYWETVEERVKPMMNKKDETKPVTIDRHKICSIMELTIVHAQPVEHDDEVTRKQLNAELAYYVALNIICNWDFETVKAGGISDSFEREHTAWLENVNHVDGFPVFSNAATWYLIEELLLLQGRLSK